MNTSRNELQLLMETVKTLRGPDGCPWDKKQTVNSLKTHIKEECLEILSAIEKNDSANLCEELGDFLYLIILVSEISMDQNQFTFDKVIKGINDKLIRRHPHVFSDSTIETEAELKQQWNRIKAQEKLNNNSQE